MVTRVVIGTGAVGQGVATEQERRRQANQQLKLARQAMRSGRLDVAERHVKQAEQLNVKYDELFAKFEDTPQEVRRDMQQMQAAKGPTRPSEQFRPSASADAPQTAAGATGFNPGGGTTALAAVASDAKSQATTYLQRGRSALKAGDVAGALGWWQKAAATKATFTDQEYNLDHLAVELRAAGIDSSLLRAPKAAPSKVALRPADITKDDLQRLPPVPENAAVPDLAFARIEDDSPDQIPATNNPLTDNNNSKRQVLRLVAQGTAALDRGDLAAAHQFAGQAQQLGVPDAAFRDGEVRPWELQCA